MRDASTGQTRSSIRPPGGQTILSWLCGLLVGALLVACSGPGQQVSAEETVRVAPCIELEAYALEMAPLLADQAKMETILDRFEHHMATLPDTDPEVAVAVLHHLWEMIEAHEARLQTISSPALAAPAVAAHSAWLTDFRSGIEYLYTYYECRVAQQMGLAYTSEYSEGYEEHDKMAQVFLSRAERIRAECAAALATARERCR